MKPSWFGMRKRVANLSKVDNPLEKIIMDTLLKNKTISIQKILFDTPGKISIKLEDGRIIIVTLKYFPELKKLTLEERKKYTIVDDRTILFSNSDLVYHLEDFMGLERKWRQR